MRARHWIVMMLLFGVSVGSAASFATATANGTTLAVFGDDGVTSTTRANVDGAVNDGAQGYVGLGDYYYWDSPTTWKSMFSPLTAKGSFLALGNHDDLNALRELFPGGSATWSRSIGGARVVAINSEQRMDVGSSQYSTIRSELCNAAEPLRVLVTHKPWWLGAGARHPGSEFPGSASAMDQLVKDCGVDLVLAGHEHNYQRLARNGAMYLIVGTGGKSLYPVAGSPAGTVASYGGYGRLLLTLRPDGYDATFRGVDGRSRDAFTSTHGDQPLPAATPSPSPASPTQTSTPTGVTFTSRAGNEWWVEAVLSGPNASRVTRVDAMDTDGPWVPLTKKWWGSWAATFHVEPGHAVTFRATLDNSQIVTSCAFTHPGGVASCGSQPSADGFEVIFSHPRGNRWWVETDATAKTGSIQSLEARIGSGPWVLLPRTAWGSYAKSMYVPDGAGVTFRAKSPEGAERSAGPMRWPP